MIFLAVLPFLVMNFKKLNKRGLSLSVAAGFFLATATVTYVDAIRLSEASYVSVVTLLTPVVLIIYSAKLVKEKITKKAMAGIMVSAIGATLIVLLPIALKQQGGFDFYPMATFLSLINVFSFPLAVISMRKANEEGVPIASVVAISSFIVAMVCLALFLVEGMPSSTIDGKFWGCSSFFRTGGWAFSTLIKLFGLQVYWRGNNWSSWLLRNFYSDFDICICTWRNLGCFSSWGLKFQPGV